jgi:hypothetical protein
MGRGGLLSPGSVCVRVVLPQIITWLMMMAVACFVVEMFHRLRGIRGTFHNPKASGILRYFLPFCCMFFLAASDMVPQPRTWDGITVNEMTLDDALAEAVVGSNRLAACEQVRWHCSRAIETLSIVAAGDGPEASSARRKLESIAIKMKEIENK